MDGQKDAFLKESVPGSHNPVGQFDSLDNIVFGSSSEHNMHGPQNSVTPG